MSKKIDLHALYSDIKSAADNYQLCCGIAVRVGTDSMCGEVCGFESGGDFLLDSEGGFLLGLSVMKLVSDGKLSPEEPVRQFVPKYDFLLPPQITVGRLLARTSGLPDPLREIMLRETRLADESIDLADSETICREHSAILSNRRLIHQLRLIDRQNTITGCGLVPSLLEESLLVDIIEKITGCSVADYQQQHIFAPLKIDARRGAYDQSTGSIAYAESAAVEYNVSTEIPGVFTLTFEELLRMADAIAKGYPMTADCYKTLCSSNLNLQTLPYGRRNGILLARSSVCGRHTEIYFDNENDLVVLVASRTPFLANADGSGGYRRFDTDVIGYLNRQLIYPSHTRMERLSHRNIPSALSVSLDLEQQNFVSAPAVVVAESALQRHPEMAAQVGGREVFVITDSKITIGIIAMFYEPSRQLARIDSLIIDRMYQHRGFGRIAVQWAAKHALREGCAKLTVCVDRRNTAAYALYKSEGFSLCAVYDSAFVLELML